MLELLNLNKTYRPKNGQSVQALKNVSLKLEEKGMVFVLGKSGSGKSTLLNVVGGLDKMDSGEIIIKGRSSKTFSGSDFDSYRNTFIGFIFQEYNILSEFNVEKNIALALELQGKKASKETVENILKQVDMQGYGKRKTTELSGGQKQRIAIARALIKEPEIIFADEPTGALDSATGIQVFDTLKKLSENKLVIVVSHDRDFAEKYADRIIEMKDGEISSDTYKHLVEVEKAITDSESIKIEEQTIKIDTTKTLSDQEIAFLVAQLQSKNNGFANSKMSKALNEIASIGNSGKTARFKKTNEKTDLKLKEYDGNELKLIKSKLNNTDALKIGASGLKVKKIRLFFTVLLSVVALGLFGFINTISSYNEANSHAQSIAGSSAQTYAVEKTINDSGYYGNSSYLISENDYQFFNTLETAGALALYGSGSGIKLSSYGLANSHSVPDGFNSFRNFNNFTFINNESDLDKYNFSIVSGQFPNDDKGILITEFQFYILKFGGFRFYDAVNDFYSIIMPENYEDILNFSIYQGSEYSNEYYISGIVSTNFNFEKYDTDAYKLANFQKRQELDLYIEAGAHNILFLNSEAKDTFYINPHIYSGNIRIMLTEHSSYLGRDFILNQNHTMYDRFMIKDQMGDNDVIVPLGILSRGNGGNPFEDVLFLKYENKGTYEMPDYGYVLRFFQTPTSPEVLFNSMTEFKTWLSVPQNNTLLKTKLMEKNAKLKIMPKSDLLEVNIAGFYLEFFDQHYLTEGFDVGSDIYTFSTKIEQEHISFGKIENVIVFFSENVSERQNAASSILNHTFNGFNFSIISEFVNAYSNLRFLFAMFESVFLVIGIVFAVFSSLLMMNFIATSISNKKREIGVLRAVGARSYDVFKIFVFESLIIAAINSIIAISAVIPFVMILNSFMAEQLNSSITFLMFGVWQVLLMVGIAVGSAIISSLLPVINITRKNPIDAINNR